MKNSFTLLIVVVFSLTVVSCQKEIEDVAGNNSNTGNTTPTTGESTTGTTDAGDIKGTWKLLYVQAKTFAAIEVSTGGVSAKTVTTSEYTSENNSGTIAIDAQNMAYTNLSYSINTRAYAKVYDNAALVDTFSVPMQFTLPPTSTSVPYKRATSDSLYFPSGSIMVNNTSQPTQPSGVRLKREQDKLFLIQTVDQSKTTIEQGVTSTTIQQASVTVALQKQ